jgi:ubiquinone/menaquinone biosynthesis C-methylase UbiE
MIKYYDYIFPVGIDQLRLIKELADKDGKILDAACGTGLYLESLAKEDYMVWGFDIDSGMVEKAIGKVKHLTTAHVMVGDFLKMNQMYMDNTFDLSYCIGNSLVHLVDLKGIKRALEQFKGILKSNGILLLQTVNFDRILAKDIKSLPLIERIEQGIRFERNYKYLIDDNLIEFAIRLSVEQDSVTHVFNDTNLLYPLTSKELVNLLKEVGFESIELYGSFKKELFNPLESSALITIVRNNSI